MECTLNCRYMKKRIGDLAVDKREENHGRPPYY